jgi:hypothetical protein
MIRKKASMKNSIQGRSALIPNEAGSKEKKLFQPSKALKPELHEGEYVFCTMAASGPPVAIDPVGWFREKEGITVILPKNQADELAFSYSFIAAWITLNIHSDLKEVGLTAAFSKALSEAKISCNVVSAYYHDHVFVPIQDARRAMEILQTSPPLLSL